MPIAVSPAAERVRSAPSPALRLVEQPVRERLTGRVTWLSGDGRRGLLSDVGGHSLPFVMSDRRDDATTFAEGDLVSYERAGDPRSAAPVGDVRSLRRRAADRARSAARLERPRQRGA